MQYRKFNKLNWNVSSLGFGCMRLPTTDGNPMSGNIDEEKAIEMIRYAIDQGVNYVDTAYPYHKGNSETVVGKALEEGYREKVKLATKSPTWLIKKPEDFDTYLNEQLTKLQTDHIDFYLLHNLTENTWTNVILKLNLLDKAEEAIKDGRIKHIGFSFHDDYNCFEKIVDGYDKWDFCQIQYNYMDTENQAGTKGLKYAAEKGLPVIVMEPLLGGKLANPPKSILDIFKGDTKGRSPVDWALQWLWNQPEVSLVLSGMSNMEQTMENIHYANGSGINALSNEELQLIDCVQEKYRERTAIPCTGCNYCMPCPSNVEIPSVFELYNYGYMHEDVKDVRGAYARQIKEKNKGNNCIQCKVCEEKCPQKIRISEWMPRVHGVLGEGMEYEKGKSI